MIEDLIKALIAALTANTEAIKLFGGNPTPTENRVNELKSEITEDLSTTQSDPLAATDPIVDSDGIPWDGRIHGSTKAMTEAGVWKQLRQPKKTFPDKAVWLQYIQDVRAELLGSTPAVQPEAIVDGVTIPQGVHNSDVMTDAYVGNKQKLDTITPPPVEEHVMLSGAKGISYESYQSAGWSDEALIEAQMMAAPTVPQAPAPDSVNIDDIRNAMQDLSSQKGAAAIVGCIAKFGRKLDEVDPERLGDLLQEMNDCPDITVPPPPA